MRAGLTRALCLMAAPLAAILLMAGAASDPAEALHDPGQEARARALFREVRCLVCQNESIDDSEAELAGDLRRIVRQQVATGSTDTQVRGFLVERYGKFVLLKPPFDAGTAALWAAPFVVVLVGGLVIYRRSRKMGVDAAPLTPQERENLRALDL